MRSTQRFFPHSCFLIIACCLAFLSQSLRAAQGDGFAGEWETTYGRMKLKVSGESATGTYRFAGGDVNDIAGKLVESGKKLNLTYTESNAAGAGSFTLSGDGQSFTGRWRENKSTQWLPWGGQRAMVPSEDFSGVWKTSFGSMRLMQQGSQVKGCYTYGERSELKGSVKSGVFQFEYTEPSGVKGSGEFKLSDDSSAFTGKWQTKDGKLGGQWSGTRVEPISGRTWLVVLEAHWESSLKQSEYSYGDMLRHFFTRVPSVAVRQRYFDGKQDFAKWCEELPYINEPIVFYISSHGNEEGITVGKEVLDGKFIGKQLIYAPDVKLVHLGACLAMAGSTPADIRSFSGLNVPVSGYTKSADWAGSAVIDFSYLDLVLSRSMKPGAAVRQLLENVSFANEQDQPNCAIKPTGLKIVE